jgi:hypothetical protein
MVLGFHLYRARGMLEWYEAGELLVSSNIDLGVQGAVWRPMEW